MVLLIDNYDSFVYNLAQYLGQLGRLVKVVRNDAIDVAGVFELAPEFVLISPGPCTPKEAGVSCDVIRECAGRVPVFGVCLGHQSIGYVYGASIVRAKQVMHGKLSNVFHANAGVFAGLENPVVATRYHSLVIEPSSLPDELEITAKTWEDEIMGVRHKAYAGTSTPMEGVQFHPESIETRGGMKILENFVRQVEQRG